MITIIVWGIGQDISSCVISLFLDFLFLIVLVNEYHFYGRFSSQLICLKKIHPDSLSIPVIRLRQPAKLILILARAYRLTNHRHTMLAWSISDSESQAKKINVIRAPLSFLLVLGMSIFSSKKSLTRVSKLTELLKFPTQMVRLIRFVSLSSVNGNRRPTSSKKTMQVSLNISAILLSQIVKSISKSHPYWMV